MHPDNLVTKWATSYKLACQIDCTIVQACCPGQHAHTTRDPYHSCAAKPDTKTSDDKHHLDGGQPLAYAIEWAKLV